MKRLWLVLFCLAVGLGAPACARHGSGVGADTRVLFIGLDGAEWSLIKALVAQGRMPNFQKLMERGISGELKSLEPLQKSPAIWTTIATGKSPREHGIKTFVEEKNGQPLTQNLRKVKAIWNILSATGRKVGVVGWLMSWPAEEVNGFIVSDYIQYVAGRNSKLQHRTWPENLYDEIAPLNRDWRTMPWSEVNRFLGQPLDTTAIGGANPDTLAILRARPMRWMISADASFADIALKLGQPAPPAFMAVYLRSMDTFGHLYWNFQHPESWPPGLLDPDMVPFFAKTMEKDYEWIDGQLGRILTLADDKTTVVLCSDHGFKGGGGGGVQDHRLEESGDGRAAYRPGRDHGRHRLRHHADTPRALRPAEGRRHAGQGALGGVRRVDPSRDVQGDAADLRNRRRRGGAGRPGVAGGRGTEGAAPLARLHQVGRRGR